MAAEQGNVKPGFLSKLGAKLTGAHNELKDKPANPGNPELPAGINGGIAELRECKIGVYKDGKHIGQPFFMAAGVVITPKVHNGVPIAGMRTQVGPIPLCDTPEASGKKKAFKDHYDDMLNHLKLLGADPAKFGTKPDEIERNLLNAMEALKQARITFRFRTWQGKKKAPGTAGYNPKYDGPDAPEPRIQHEWNGACELEVTAGEDATTAGVEDNSANEMIAAENAEDAAAEAPDETPADDTAEPAEGEEGGEEGATANEWAESEDLDALLAAASADDGDAQDRLNELAMAATGKTLEEVEAEAATWEEVVALCQPAEPEEAPKPKKGDMAKYFPIDPKTKKPVKKAVSVEITAVDAKTETATIKRLDTKAVITKVKWSALDLS